MLFLLSLCLSTLAQMSPFLGEVHQEKILGVWLSDDQEVKLEIFKKGSKYCGKIVWFKEGKDTGKHPYDVKNPDPSLRKRKILNLVILKDFVYEPKSQKWVKGKIYHPQQGQVYKGMMWLESPEKLRIRGYWGILYKTNTWHKVRN